MFAKLKLLDCAPNNSPFPIELLWHSSTRNKKKRVIKFAAHTMGRLNYLLKNLRKLKNQQQKKNA